MKTKTFVLVAVAVFAVIVGGVIYVVAGGGGDRRVGALTASSIAGYQIVGAQVEFARLAASEVRVHCPAGKVVIGGGGRTGTGPSMDGNITDSYPEDSDTWYVRAYNPGVILSGLHAVAICANAG